MASRHTRGCSASLVIREMQVKTMRSYHLTPVRRAIIINPTEKSQQGCGEGGTLVPCWWGCSLVKPPWKTLRRVLKKLKTNLPDDPEIPLLGFTQRNSKREFKRVCASPCSSQHCLRQPKKQKQPKCPSVEKWVEGLLPSHQQGRRPYLWRQHGWTQRVSR